MTRLDGNPDRDLAWNGTGVEERLEPYLEGEPNRYESKYCDLSWPERYCVYVISCCGYRSTDAFLDAMEFDYDHTVHRRGGSNDIPSWVWAAFYADRRFYVGMTHDICKRLGDHIDHAPDVTTFTEYFPPKRIRSLEFVATADEARELERSTARRLERRTQNAFVAQK